MSLTCAYFAVDHPQFLRLLVSPSRLWIILMSRAMGGERQSGEENGRRRGGCSHDNIIPERQPHCVGTSLLWSSTGTSMTGGTRHQVGAPFVPCIAVMGKIAIGFDRNQEGSVGVFRRAP